ncbi:MAG: hypothetical protein ACREKN_08335 [Longimicrobiaceae bacterium]
MAKTEQKANGGESARELIEERTRVRSWLDRLDESAPGDTPEHVTRRVRDDYRARLERLTEELATRVESVRESLERARAELEEAEAEYAAARDRLEEARLRHRLGELDDDNWNSERPELEERVEQAGEQRGRARTQASRMEDLVREIESAAGHAPAAEPQLPEETVPGAEAAHGEEAGEWEPVISEVADAPEEGEEAQAGDLPWLGEPASEEAAAEPAKEDRAGDEDMAFLEELDRAIAASSDTSPAAAPSQPKPAGEEESGRRPVTSATIPCKECGAENDARAWYCEVCGVELA